MNDRTRCCRLLPAAISVCASMLAIASADDAQPSATSMLGTEAGQVRDDNDLKMKLVWCPPAFVTMEQVDPDPRRADNVTSVRVLLTRGYWLGRYEITQAEWKRLARSEPWKGQADTPEGDDFPAVHVSWFDAMEFCRTLTAEERKAGRLPADWVYTLPTDAQWDRACRAHTEMAFSFGDDEGDLGDYAWYNENVFNTPVLGARRVGQKKPNPWGLYDIHGNVFEWCRDHYSSTIPGGRDPEVSDGELRVHRGGGGRNDGRFCQPAFRGQNPPGYKADYLGFRVALTPVRPAADNPAK